MAIQQTPTEQPMRQATRLRVRVSDDTGKGRPVNVTIPIRLARWGMKMARTFAPELKDANLDWDAIGSLIDEGARGEIVHVEDEQKHQTIEVSVE